MSDRASTRAPKTHAALRATALGLVLALSVGAAGCGGDENDPATHVKRLDDPARRVAALNRLELFFNDADSKDKDSAEKPNLKPLLEKIAAPLNQLCLKGDLDEKSQSKVVKLLANSRDDRGKECLLKTLKDYKPGQTEEDIRWVVRAVRAQKMKEAADPLFDVFTKMKPSSEKGASVFRDVYEAMTVLQDPSWEPKLIALLGKPMKTADPKNKEDFKDTVDQAGWQVTAATLLGNMKSAKAVDALMRVTLTNTKGPVKGDAINALVKIGKPSSDAAVALLKGENKELVDLAKTEFLKGAGDKPNEATKKAADLAHVDMAARILATIGREESAAPLLEAMAKADDLQRVFISNTLFKLPKSEATTKAFLETYAKIELSLTFPNAPSAKEALLNWAPMFYDASVVPVLIKEATEAKGEEADINGLKESTLIAVMKVGTASQWPEIEKLAATKVTGPDNKPTTLAKSVEKQYKEAGDLIKECNEDGACYLKKYLELGQKEGFGAVKAAFMVGVHGKEEMKMPIFEALPKMKNPDAASVGLQLLDHFSPKGDKALADRIQKMVDTANETKDEQKQREVRPFRDLLYRLNARAQ